MQVKALVLAVGMYRAQACDLKRQLHAAWSALDQLMFDMLRHLETHRDDTKYCETVLKRLEDMQAILTLKGIDIEKELKDFEEKRKNG